MGERNFRRYVERYHKQGEAGLLDKRLTQASHRCAPVDEVLKLTDLYSTRYNGWNVKHFYSFYAREHDGSRSYTWVKNELQKAKLVRKAKDNTVSFKGRSLQIPSDEYRNHYVRTSVRIYRYLDGGLAIFHGPRKLADFPPVQKEETSKPELPFFGLKAMK